MLWRRPTDTGSGGPRGPADPRTLRTRRTRRTCPARRTPRVREHGDSDRTRGCSSRRSRVAASPPFPGARAPAEAQYPVVTPITVIAGRVVSVNPKLRFVVLDFSLNPLPPIDQRLNVYRQGQKVGEVKISGPARNSHIVADIVAGNAQPGDRVRDD